MFLYNQFAEIPPCVTINVREIPGVLFVKITTITSRLNRTVITAASKQIAQFTKLKLKKLQKRINYE